MADLIDKMKAEISIIDLAQRLGLDMKQRPHGNVDCICPVCEYPSKRVVHRHLTLYPDNKFWCFACGKGGDIFNLYAFVTGGSLKDAVKRVKSMYGYDVDPTGDRSIQAIYGSQKPPIPEPIEKPEIDIKDPDIQNIYIALTESLILSARGREYLTRRGITEETIKRFNILSIDEPRQIRELMLAKFKPEDLVKSGLFYIRDEQPNFSFFRPGIVFVHYRPTYIAGLSARLYDGYPKYLKLNGVPSSVFEGFLNGEKELFIFEGIINGLSFLELTGKNNFIALSGLLSQSRYADLIETYKTRKLILAVDPDKAGASCLERIGNCYYLKYDELCIKLGLPELPKKEDGTPYDMNDILKKIRGIE